LGPYIAQVWGWDDAFQQTYHSEHFSPNNATLLLHQERVIGFLEKTEKLDSLFIQNLLIVPDFQNKGIGTSLLKQLIEETRKPKKAVTLNVLKVNTRAFSLYQSLGFTVRTTTGVAFEMVLLA
ncbi:MAG: GNAT family N-acetyltransferase, partial [Bacteroidota bacterium]|nr:GNAT family N-acetyltransferase [Bacteroidota bacterium]